MSRTIRTIIVDDIPAAITKLENDLTAFPEIEVIERLSSSKEAVDAIITQQPDLLFLDIEMPGMSGLELLDKIKDEVRGLRVIFYTAYNQYLIDAVRTSAFDYLQKPYLPEELSLIINRLPDNSDCQSDTFSQSLQQFVKKEGRFAIQTITGLMLVKCEEVVLFQYAQKQRCWFMTMQNNAVHKLRTAINAKELLLLCDSFVQINPQCIINLDYLFSIENKTLKCVLCPPFSDINETVSARCYKKLKDNLSIL